MSCLPYKSLATKHYLDKNSKDMSNNAHRERMSVKETKQ